MASLEDKLARSGREEKRARIEKWFWVLFIVPYIVFFSHSVAIIGLLSIYALIATVRSVQMAAKAEIAGYENPKPESESEV